MKYEFDLQSRLCVSLPQNNTKLSKKIFVLEKDFAKKKEGKGVDTEKLVSL